MGKLLGLGSSRWLWRLWKAEYEVSLQEHVNLGLTHRSSSCCPSPLVTGMLVILSSCHLGDGSAMRGLCLQQKQFWEMGFKTSSVLAEEMNTPSAFPGQELQSHLCHF